MIRLKPNKTPSFKTFSLNFNVYLCYYNNHLSITLLANKIIMRATSEEAVYLLKW